MVQPIYKIELISIIEFFSNKVSFVCPNNIIVRLISWGWVWLGMGKYPRKDVWVWVDGGIELPVKERVNVNGWCQSMNEEMGIGMELGMGRRRDIRTMSRPVSVPVIWAFFFYFILFLNVYSTFSPFSFSFHHFLVSYVFISRKKKVLV